MTATAARGQTVNLRLPGHNDAREMVRLARESRVLDVNSHYAYLLLCEHFRDTCVVAERDGQAIGFVAAYRLPRRPETLFVWQVSVSSEARGRGLASQMLAELIGRGRASGIRFLEATVTPSNAASRALFESLAARHNAACRTRLLFPSEVFGAAGEHEPEELFRIGPFPDVHVRSPG